MYSHTTNSQQPKGWECHQIPPEACSCHFLALLSLAQLMRPPCVLIVSWLLTFFCSVTIKTSQSIATLGHVFRNNASGPGSLIFGFRIIYPLFPFRWELHFSLTMASKVVGLWLCFFHLFARPHLYLLAVGTVGILNLDPPGIASSLNWDTKESSEFSELVFMCEAESSLHPPACL